MLFAINLCSCRVCKARRRVTSRPQSLQAEWLFALCMYVPVIGFQHRTVKV